MLTFCSTWFCSQAMFSSISNIYMTLWVYLNLPVALNHYGWNFQFFKCLKHISSAFQDSIVIFWPMMFHTMFPSLQECKGRQRLWKKNRGMWDFPKGHILTRLLESRIHKSACQYTKMCISTAVTVRFILAPPLICPMLIMSLMKY